MNIDDRSYDPAYLRLAAQDETDHRTKPGRTGPYRQPEVAEDEDWAAGL